VSVQEQQPLWMPHSKIGVGVPLNLFWRLASCFACSSMEYSRHDYCDAFVPSARKETLSGDIESGRALFASIFLALK